MYARRINGQTLTFIVSGMLWNRSLVMMDTQTRSLWAHLLGQAMAGPLKGKMLEAIPSELTTWKAWRKQHPETTVLNMSRTHRDYVREFYRRPGDFVYGVVVAGRAYHVPFPVLLEDPVLNMQFKEEKLVVTFDRDSATARLFSSAVGDRSLSFVSAENGRMRDEQTGTIWSRNTGEAVAGPLKGEALEQRVGVTSFAKPWKIFHPESREARPSGSQ